MNIFSRIKETTFKIKAMKRIENILRKENNNFINKIDKIYHKLDNHHLFLS